VSKLDTEEAKKLYLIMLSANKTYYSMKNLYGTVE
jgi:hypothetical protein